MDKILNVSLIIIKHLSKDGKNVLDAFFVILMIQSALKKERNIMKNPIIYRGHKSSVCYKSLRYYQYYKLTVK